MNCVLCGTSDCAGGWWVVAKGKPAALCLQCANDPALEQVRAALPCNCPSSGHLPTCPLRNYPEPEPNPLHVIGAAILAASAKAKATYREGERVREAGAQLPKTVFKFLVQVEIEQDALHCNWLAHYSKNDGTGPASLACQSCIDAQRSYLRALISAQVSNYLIGKDPLHWFPYKPQITVTHEP